MDRLAIFWLWIVTDKDLKFACRVIVWSGLVNHRFRTPGFFPEPQTEMFKYVAFKATH